MRIIEEELQFRREQEKSMQMHLDNYQEINSRLRDRITQLEAHPRQLTINKVESRSTTFQDPDYSCEMSRELSRKSCLEASLPKPRESRAGDSKENHPLTPKSRVSISMEGAARRELEGLNVIRERRKVFM